jgi:glycosyltransferase involved in cell wall biosynthesis
VSFLVAIPVFNEERHLEGVLDEVRRHADDILVVDDGSTDGTAALLARQPNLRIVTHPQNRGYGAALASAFDYAQKAGVETLVTMDSDGQHEAARIPVLLEAIHDADIVSGSRYLRDFRENTHAPQGRREINRTITAELNARFGLNVTDAFCGFKAYRGSALAQLRPTETGWGMPLQLWVQAARLGLRIREIGVPRVYLDPNRSFGGGMDDHEARLAYYRRVIAAAEADTNFPPSPVHPESTGPCNLAAFLNRGGCR